MISLNQILTLEQKVEGAVQKITQLQTENAALRKSVLELSNALSAKSEQLTSLLQEQTKIESGFLSALDRLGCIDNTQLPVASNVPQMPMGGDQNPPNGDASQNNTSVEGFQSGDSSQQTGDMPQSPQDQQNFDGQPQGPDGNQGNQNQEAQPSQGENNQW